MNGSKKFKILVIEDNEQMSEMLSDYLTGKFPDSEISVFNTGEDAISATKTSPNVIILDYNLDTQNPKALNGLQVLMKFKKLFNAPVIFLTGQEKPEISANVIKYGAYDYVVKNQQSFSKIENIIRNIQEQKPQKKNIFTLKMVVILLIVLILFVVALFFLKGT